MDSRWKNYDNGTLVFYLPFTLFIVNVDFIWLSVYNYRTEKSNLDHPKNSIFLTHERQLQYMTAR